MTKENKDKRPVRFPDQVTTSTPVDGTVDQQPQFDRQRAENREGSKTNASSSVTTRVIPASSRRAAEAILKDLRKRFELTGPDSDYLELHDDGAITVHHTNAWRKKRTAVKRLPSVTE